MGIEPTLAAWKAEVLPLNYTCVSVNIIISNKISFVNKKSVFSKKYCFNLKNNNYIRKNVKNAHIRNIFVQPQTRNLN